MQKNIRGEEKTMGNQETKLTIRKNYHHYHVPSMSNIHSLKKDAIFVSDANSISHELAKCLGAIMVKRFSDLKFNPEIVRALGVISDEVAKFGFEKNHGSFLTEASPNESPNRRVDLVSLTDNQRYEFETDKTINKSNCCTIYI